MPIDLSAVNWVYVGVLSVFAFVATVIGNILAAIVFAALFVGWTYYPHHLPLPTRLAPG
jgi:uncharacterized membrane protein YuzA (DUF378 family)